MPGLVAGLVVAVVLVAVDLPVVGAVAFVVVAGALWAWLWRAAPGAVLRAVGARECDEWEAPRLHNLVDGLCATMGLPKPAICLVDSAVPNAMAVGRDPSTASLVVTSGLEPSLTLVQLEGVLAHELVHVKRGDTVLAGVAVMIVRPWAVLRGTEWGAAAVHRVVGRGREYAADQRAAGVVRYPPGIGTALEVMVATDESATWPPGGSRTAALTRWLWIDPRVGSGDTMPADGDLDDPRVRAAALALR